MNHVYCRIDREGGRIDLMDDLPEYREMIINPKP
jgi:hypothetical protein